MRHLVVDLFQVFQEPYGGRMDQTQNQVIFVTYDALFAAGVSDKVRYQFRLIIANGYDDFIVRHNPQGDSRERDSLFLALYRNSNDSQ